MADQAVLNSTGGNKRCSILHKFEEKGSLMRENFINTGPSQEANS